MSLKFMWNGIKGSDGKLQSASYSDGPLISYPAGTLTIYAKSYSGFSAEVADAFVIKNDSDSMTDYFVKDSIRVLPDHPLYAEVKAAVDAQTTHFDRMQAKRSARWGA